MSTFTGTQVCFKNHRKEKKRKKYLLKRPGRSSLLILIKLVKLVHKMVRKTDGRESYK